MTDSFYQGQNTAVRCFVDPVQSLPMPCLMIAARNSLEHAGYAAPGWEARYVPCQCEGAFKRLGYALAWDFVTLCRKGQIVPDVPRFVAAYGAGAPPPLWNDNCKWTAEGIRKGNQSIFFAAAFNIMREFDPETVACSNGISGFLETGNDNRRCG